MAGGTRASKRFSKLVGDVGVSRGLWENILKEVATATKAPESKILCFGRSGIGKRTLLQALHTHACPLAASNDAAAQAVPEGGHSRAVGIDFAHFGARDPELEEAAAGNDFNCPSACSVLILEETVHEKLLLSRLRPEALEYTAALICLDLKAPWTMMEDLRTWFEALRQLTSELMQQLPLDEQDRLRKRIADSLGSYEEPSPAEGESAADGSKGGAASLTCNLGIPVIVVVTRADTVSALESPKTNAWVETIEAYLRNECLAYGATLVYTTVQAKTRNVDVLFEYLMHRLYGYALHSAPIVPSKDALFVPSGWDSQERIDKTASGLQSGGLDRSFESIVVSLEAPPPMPPAEVSCDDMQTFLKRSAAVLQKMGAVSATGGKAKSGLSGALGASLNLGGGAGAKKSELSAAGAGKRASIEGAAKVGINKGDNASVANFFQNLLTRGQSGAGASGGTDGKKPSLVPPAAKASAGAGTPSTAGPVEAKISPVSPTAVAPAVSLKVPDAVPAESKSADAAPAEGKSADVAPAEGKSADVAPAESKSS